MEAELVNAIKPFVHSNTSKEKINALIRRMSVGSCDDMFVAMSRISDPPSLKGLLKKKGVDSREFRKLCEVYLAYVSSKLLGEIHEEIRSFSSGIMYLEPLRATAQRYYRQQPLAVGEIDSKGENVAMFFDNLSSHELSHFNEWASKFFGVKIVPIKEGGHVSITIQYEGEDGGTNIADMGFGFSQVLPIAVQLWSAKFGDIVRLPFRRHKRGSLIVIEQPELHLHPEYQARLADLFVAAMSNEQGDRDKTGGLSMVVETHSPNLINRLGELIAKRAVLKDDVQVVLFEQDIPGYKTVTGVSSFNEDGILEDWPIGFFEPRR